jgi:predicted transcriptional regulator
MIGRRYAVGATLYNCGYRHEPRCKCRSQSIRKALGFNRREREYREFCRRVFVAKTKTIFEIDEDAEARAIAEAEADVAAGRLVPHEKVVKWLKSWGTPDELPCPIPKR